MKTIQADWEKPAEFRSICLTRHLPILWSWETLVGPRRAGWALTKASAKMAARKALSASCALGECSETSELQVKGPDDASFARRARMNALLREYWSVAANGADARGLAVGLREWTWSAPTSAQRRRSSPDLG